MSRRTHVALRALVSFAALALSLAWPTTARATQPEPPPAVPPPAVVDGGAPEAPSTPNAPVAPTKEAASPSTSEPRPPRTEASGDDRPPPKTSDLVAHASLDVGAYQDNVAVSVLTPSVGARVESPTAGWGINGRYLVDVVTAASPDIVATASPRWTEVRHAGNLNGRYKPRDFGVGVGVVTSYTPDYLSLGANGQLIQDLDDKNLTLTAGYGFGHDVIGRTGTPFSIFSRQLDYHSLSAGASRVINPSLVVGLLGDLIIERGDQSKPYRYIPIFSPADAPNVARGASPDAIAAMRLQARPLEQLPLERERLALSGRIAWRLASSTVRIDNRLYADTWGMRATTLDARWLFGAGDRVILWPHARFHVQNGVNFWKRAYAATSANDLPALRTGDRELAPLYNVGLGAGIRLALGRARAREDWVFTTTIDGVYTSFSDAMYVTSRISGLVSSGLEMAF